MWLESLSFFRRYFNYLVHISTHPGRCIDICNELQMWKQSRMYVRGLVWGMLCPPVHIWQTGDAWFMSFAISLHSNNKDKWPSSSQVWDRYKGEVIYLWSLTSISPNVSSSNEHVRLMVQLSQRLKECDLLEEHLAPLRMFSKDEPVKKFAH